MKAKNMKNTLRKLSILAAVTVPLVFSGCTWFNDKPPVSTLENPTRSRTLGDYEVNGKVLAQQVCATCHGITGQSDSPMYPKLAGQQKDYIVVQLKDLRDQSRSDKYAIVYMWGMARNLTDKQIDELADYFSAQTPMYGEANHSTSAQAQLKRGEDIFNNGVPTAGVVACNGCHGPEGAGMAEIPRIAGQHSDYIVKQLNAFQHPDDKALMEMGGNTWAPKMYDLHRNLERGAAMNAMVANMSQEDVEAVALYLNTMNR